MLTGLPDNTYLQEDIAKLVWKYFTEQTLHSFNYNVTVLSLQRRVKTRRLSHTDRNLLATLLIPGFLLVIELSWRLSPTLTVFPFTSPGLSVFQQLGCMLQIYRRSHQKSSFCERLHPECPLGFGEYAHWIQWGMETLGKLSRIM